MAKFPEHPGIVRMVDRFHQTTKEIPVAQVPAANRFVYYKGKVRTENATEATERIPIVVVEMMPLDAKGNLVPPESAATIQVSEFGPNRRPLRTTTMVPSKPPK
jgi:hypothetical protein